METLKLYRGEQLVAEVMLGERPVELGRAAGCDLVVDDPELAARHWLAMRRLGTVVAYDVSHGRHGRPQHLPLGMRVALGRDHALLRERKSATESALDVNRDRDTEPLRQDMRPVAQWTLVIGQGGDARKLRIRDHPIQVGRGPDNHVVLSDPAASYRHCRFEPSGDGVMLRDLGSINGTFANGMRVERVLVEAGARVRVGRTELYLVARDASSRVAGSELVAESPGMLTLLAETRRLAALPWPALILGESGTGKEGIASLLHGHSGRVGPLVTLNAGGVPGELIESELFGHERGAFTGASHARRGAFEQAERGTLFLDEIGELPLALQARLLRVLESGELRRVGAEAARCVDVRVVCATHRDLRAMVAAGRFRQDLYFRIARLVLEVPPLRARRDDIAALSAHILAGFESVLGRRELTPKALERLCRYPWPGNVRELRNVLCAAAVQVPACAIEPSHVERALDRVGGLSQVRIVTEQALHTALEQHRGNLSAAARALGLARSTLRDRLRQRSSATEPPPNDGLACGLRDAPADPA